MKLTPQKFSTALLIICIVLFGMAWLCSCTTTKEVFKEVKTVDSSYVKKYDSLRKTDAIKIQQLNRQLTEAKKTQVKFEKVPCPPSVINIDSACSKDSMVKIIRQQAAYIASLKNSVTVLADGSTKYEGQIKSFKSELNRKEDEQQDLYSRYSEVVQVKDSLSNQVSVKDSIIQKYKKGGLKWYWYFIFFIITFTAGAVFDRKFGQYFKLPKL